jgi:hypothetical protein
VGGVASGAVVNVNLATTLVDAWHAVDRREGQRRARLSIDSALGIPIWADDIDLSDTNKWFDGAVFLKDVRAHGSLEPAIMQLLAEVRGGRHVHFRGPPSARTADLGEWWKNTDVSQLVKDGLSSLGEGLGQTIGGAGVNFVLAEFLDAVGLGRFKDFLFPIGHMIDQLNAIAAQVTVVKGLVEQGIQATEFSQYNDLVSKVGWIESDVKNLEEDLTLEAKMSPDDPTLKNYNDDLINRIKLQLVDPDAAGQLDNALHPAAPKAYGILQAASAYLGSRKPFYTQAASNAMQAVFNYYQLMQLRLSILLTNYYSTRPDTFNPENIKAKAVDRITTNIAGLRDKMMKPPLPPDTFIDLRTDTNHPMLLWGPVMWVNGGPLEHYCVDQHGVRHRFFYDVSQLTCDPGPPSLKTSSPPRISSRLCWTAGRATRHSHGCRRRPVCR